MSTTSSTGNTTAKPTVKRDEVMDKWLDEAIAALEVKLQNFDEIHKDLDLTSIPSTEECITVEDMVKRHYYDNMEVDNFKIPLELDDS